MGCQSCKNKKKSEGLNIFNKNNREDNRLPAKEGDFVYKIFNITIRLFMFLISVAITPVIVLFVVYLLFKTIVLNKGQINLTPSLLKVATMLRIGKKKKNNDKDEFEDLDVNKPEDYELVEKVDKIVL